VYQISKRYLNPDVAEKFRVKAQERSFLEIIND